MSRNNTYPQHVVTAVIVAHDGAPWLSHVIDALLEQTRPVQRVVAVDTGSRDRSGGLLASKLGSGVVFGMDRGTGYGAAVAKALQHKAANVAVPVPSAAGQSGRGQARGQDDRVEWVWLLHDDCEPAADALEQLLRGAAETPQAAVLGPKVMDWSDRDVILEAGLTIDTVGRRITGIEPREVDQGQHDGDRDTLAVGSPGMLIRRDVWDLVRGFDPGMGLFREDVDFCWRVHAAGFRVRVITDAVVFHAQAAARRRRSVSVGRRPQLLNRRNALLTLAGNLPLVPMLKSLAGNICVSFLRVLFFLVAKRVTAALDESAAVGSVLLHPLRLMRVRSMRARGRKAAYSRLRAEIPPGRSLRRLAEFVAAMFATEQQATAGSHHATEDPDEADDFLLTDSGIVQRILTSPGVLLFIGLVVVTVAAERSLLSAGTLGGGALLPAGGAASVWHQYLLGFHPTGVGSPSTSPAYLAVLGLLATLLTGKAWLAVDVILLGCVPIAGLTAYFAIRRVTASVPVRIWAAATYALIPVAAGAIAAGRVGTAAAFALIPLIGLQAGRMFSQPPRIARRAAWATGLVTAVAAAFVPMVWVIALLAAAVAAALLRGGRRQLINTGIAVVVPAVLLIPWTFQLAAHPSGLLLEAGVPQPGLASPHLATRSLMLLSPGGPGLPPFWVTAGLILVALVALLASRRRRLVLSGWTVAVVGLLVAIPASRLSVRPAVSGPAVTSWPGAALAITAAGLLLAAAAGGDGLRTAVSSGRTGARRITGGRGVAIAALAVIGCSAPVAAGAFWVRHGVDGPVGAARGQIVPPLVSDDAVSGAQVRTLILSRPGSGISYQLLRGTGLNLGDAELAPVPAAESALRTAVAALAAPGGGQAVDQAQALARFDIGFVLLRAPVDPTLARTLDAVTGLRPVSMTASFDLWRLATMPSRVSVLEGSGAVVPVASGPVNVSGAAAPAAGGTLLLAEPAGGWQATLNGHALTSVPSPAGSWAQAFRLPSGGGTLDIGRSELGHELALALELLAALVVAALALPGVRSAAETGAE
ncbi:MAG: glycosyltransferase family 2 protein, partial [Streptosporangiaceae bacterium]